MSMTDEKRAELKALAENPEGTGLSNAAITFRATTRALLADLEEAERTINRQQTAIDGQVAEINTLKDDRNSLLAKKFSKFNGEECWIWQGDGEDHLESLVCPVVIAPADLMAVQAELAATRKQLAEAQARLAHVNGCFEAASDEGLLERIAEVGHAYGDGSLADLVQRRLLHAPKTDPHSALQSAIEQARHEEREACATLIKRVRSGLGEVSMRASIIYDTCEQIEKAILSRNEK